MKTPTPLLICFKQGISNRQQNIYFTKEKQQMIKKIFKRYRHLIREMFLYGIIGSTSAGIDTLVFSFLVFELGVFSVVANCISVVIGISISFTLNLNFTFKVKDKIVRRGISFFSVGLFGLSLSSGLIALGEYLDWNILYTKISTIFIVALIQYLLNKFISFRKTKLMETE